MKVYEALIQYKEIGEIENDKLDSSDKLYGYAMKAYHESERYDPFQECFMVIGLNNQNFVNGYKITNIGIINTTLIDIMQIYKFLILTHSPNFMLVHNHPSGVVNPSNGDIQLTKRFTESARIMEMNFYDHLIVAENPINDKFYSFNQNGIIQS